MRIEWHRAKAAANLRKHGVSFQDVEPVFYDPAALSMPDSFSDTEERFIVVGSDALARVVTVVFTYRARSIRLISARRASHKERKAYERRIRSV